MAHDIARGRSLPSPALAQSSMQSTLEHTGMCIGAYRHTGMCIGAYRHTGMCIGAYAVCASTHNAVW